MAITADLVTAEQIRELECDGSIDRPTMEAALSEALPPWYWGAYLINEQRYVARARCAAILNARRTCRACEGDGILEADASTPTYERVTRDSRRCNYCGGKGWVRR